MEISNIEDKDKEALPCLGGYLFGAQRGEKWKMTEKEMSQERFKAKPEELKVIFRPQCIDCRKNINKDSCEEFKSKPKDYAKNKVECPLFVARYEEG